MTDEMKEILDTIQESYKQGYKDAIDNICEWLERRQVVDLEVPNIEKFINDLRKDMEEQQ